jgi:hypothetical protein
MAEANVTQMSDYKARPGRTLAMSFVKIDEARRYAEAEKPFSDDVQPDKGRPNDARH